MAEMDLVKREELWADFMMSSVQPEKDLQSLKEAVAKVNDDFARVSKWDAEWHAAVFRGERAYVEEEIGGLYRHLKHLYDGIEDLLSRFEHEGNTVEGSARFRSNHDELRSVLTPDGEFFDDEALIAKQDEAIEAHRRGETVEFEEMGD